MDLLAGAFETTQAALGRGADRRQVGEPRQAPRFGVVGGGEGAQHSCAETVKIVLIHRPYFFSSAPPRSGVVFVSR